MWNADVCSWYDAVADISRVAAVVQVVTKKGDSLYGKPLLSRIFKAVVATLSTFPLQLPAILESADAPRVIN